jgi:DNA replication and repair protein RecF
MHLKSLMLQHFKNYNSQQFEFAEGINCIVGPNGSGKTNLLDAIHMLSLTKSAFNHIDHDLIMEGNDFLRMKADINNDSKQNTIEIRLKSGEKKEVFWNENAYQKLSEHIGKFPAVLISPNDTDLIRQGSESRRRFIDACISTVNKDYLQSLTDYQRLLRQRNNFLKSLNENQKPDPVLLEAYDEKLIPLNRYISKSRSELLDRFGDDFRKFYRKLSGDKEEITWQYESKCLLEDFPERYRKNIDRDVFLQRTNMGIHKDDFDFRIDGRSVKKYASQGQQKSTVLSLKLIQYMLFHTHFGFAPVLLLDDIFDKLDSGRMSRLMEIISEQSFHQVFVTDAHPERSIEIFKGSAHEIRIFEIREGKANQIE